MQNSYSFPTLLDKPIVPSILERAETVYREEGIVRLMKKGICFGYNKYLRSRYNNYVRPWLPKRTVFYNEVPVHAGRLGDSLIPCQDTDIPGYESALISSLRQHGGEQDTIVIVGGGWGISTVIASRQVGEYGKVITFEGSGEAVLNVKETVHLNGMDDIVSIYHAVVAKAVSLRGNEDDAEKIPPEELPECDVLVLDCEGAELDIIERMNITPRFLVVETHGIYGATESKVRNLLEQANYDIIARDVAETRLKDKCRKKGIYVLTATHQRIPR